MRLGDFRKETAEYPDDTLIDDLMFMQWLPAHYDGRPSEYKDHEMIYQNEPKIRLYMFDSRQWFWDCCESNLTYDENRDIFLKKFKRGDGIEDDRWNRYLMNLKYKFHEYWNEIEWQEYMKEENVE